MTGDNVLFCIGTSKGRKKIQATPTKRDLGTSWGLFSKFPTSTPVFLNIEFPPPHPERFLPLPRGLSYDCFDRDKKKLTAA